MKPKVVVIVGPTASGKSAYAITLAKQFNGEIISADSRQVYRGLNLGTGKVTKKEMAGIRHHLLSVANPRTVFSAHDFKQLAEQALGTILAQNKVPIIVGGTGFYIDVLLGRYSLPPVPPNPKLRKRLEALSTEKLFETLSRMDRKRAQTIDTKNRVRLIRAIEIATTLGSVPPREKEGIYDALWIGLMPKPQELKKNIHKRLLARLKLGMVAEVKRLHQKGLSWKRMNALGLEYRALAHHLRGQTTKEEMITSLNQEINQYTKRQKQWFQPNKDIVWFDPYKTSSKKEMEKRVRIFLNPLIGKG